MKTFILIIILNLIFFNGILFSQEKENSSLFLFVDEVQLSVNHTFSTVHETRLGFGLGMYNILKSTKRYSVITGVEFNSSSLFVDFLILNKYSAVSDVEFNFNSIVLPLWIRNRLGKKELFIIDYGLLLDFGFLSRWKGTKYQSTPVSGVKEYSFVEKYNMFSPGIHFGGGYKFSVSSYQFYLKANLKWMIFKYENNDRNPGFRHQYISFSLGFSKK